MQVARHFLRRLKPQTASVRTSVLRLYERKEKKTYLVTATGNLARIIFLGQGLDLANVEGSFNSMSCGLLQVCVFLSCGMFMRSGG